MVRVERKIVNTILCKENSDKDKPLFDTVTPRIRERLERGQTGKSQAQRWIMEPSTEP